MEWGREDSNLRRLSRRVYSPFPLATRAHPREAAILAARPRCRTGDARRRRSSRGRLRIPPLSVLARSEMAEIAGNAAADPDAERRGTGYPVPDRVCARRRRPLRLLVRIDGLRPRRDGRARHRARLPHHGLAGSLPAGAVRLESSTRAPTRTSSSSCATGAALPLRADGLTVDEDALEPGTVGEARGAPRARVRGLRVQLAPGPLRAVLQHGRPLPRRHAHRAGGASR